MTFQEIAADLDATVTKAKPLLDNLSAHETTSRRGPDKWSKKEIVGHLIDSASNNHQRFVRAALQGHLSFPAYAQASMVQIQRYHNLDWKVLVGLWGNYNRFLAHVIHHLPESSFAVICHIGENKPATLGWVCQDYVIHLKHHLKQIVGEHF